MALREILSRGLKYKSDDTNRIERDGHVDWRFIILILRGGDGGVEERQINRSR